MALSNRILDRTSDSTLLRACGWAQHSAGTLAQPLSSGRNQMLLAWPLLLRLLWGNREKDWLFQMAVMAVAQKTGTKMGCPCK